ncbi:MAG: ribonuclease, partial [Thermoleophilia bacterium]|nr:ribonuclease [Thermoleophilia bacterium]
LLRWPLVIGMVFTWLSVTYALSPGDRQGYKIVTPGIVSAFVLWLAFAVTFSWYVDQVSNQSKLYGTFTGLIALQLYVYWSCLIVLFGAELDNALSRRGGDAGT